jgi:membrane carboxypeptidase/penicillin-binding protein
VKPFVWAAALDMGRNSGLTAAHRIVDEPFARMAGSGKLWQPKNFDGKFHGPMTLRNALERSVNIVSIKLVDRPEIGMPNVRSYLYDAGFEYPIPDDVSLTIALGSHSVIPLEQAVAYSTFAKGGRYTPATFIDKIMDRDGNTIYETDIRYNEGGKGFQRRPRLRRHELARRRCDQRYRRADYGGSNGRARERPVPPTTAATFGFAVSRRNSPVWCGWATKISGHSAAAPTIPAAASPRRFGPTS